MVKKILCLCDRGRVRSKYLAEYLFSLGYKTRYGGLGVFRRPVKNFDEGDVLWADIVIVPRSIYARIFKKKFPEFNGRIITLHVHDLPSKKAKEMLVYPRLKRQIDNKISAGEI